MIVNIVKFIVLVVVTFFFMELLTNKNKKISAVGTILVCCSSAIAYEGVVNAIICGEVLIVILEFLMNSKNAILKNIALILAGICIGYYKFGIGYYGKWHGFEQILIFVYIALAIWVVLKNRKDFKTSIKGVLKVVPGFILGALACALIIYYGYCNGFAGNIVTDNSTKNNGLAQLFSYGYSMFLPFVDTGENIAYAGFVSIFPLSLILAMVYAYKNEKHLEFLMPMIIVIVFESIFCMTANSILGNILFISNYYIEMASLALGLACIYLYIYMIANIDENIFKLTNSIKIVLALLVLFFLIPKPNVFTSNVYLYVLTMCLTLLYFLFINFADKRYQKLLLVVLTLWSLISFVPVVIMAI
jgi:hypothetical protein